MRRYAPSYFLRSSNPEQKYKSFVSGFLIFENDLRYFNVYEESNSFSISFRI